jgi:NADH:ubiquinone oxidoreductase subunit B-like Fe-S oxidoreductase
MAVFFMWHAVDAARFGCVIIAKSSDIRDMILLGQIKQKMNTITARWYVCGQC